jgi:biopolymer transport protein TolQ
MNDVLSVGLTQAEIVMAAGTNAQKSGTLEDMIQLVVEASTIVQIVIIVLFLFIFACAFIIVYKYIQIRRAQKQTMRFLKVFWESKRLDEIYQTADDMKQSPMSQLFKAGYIELSKLKGAKKDDSVATDETHVGDIENVERALRRASSTEITHLESMVPFLATTGSTAPFVGLFGTVIGIMISFMQISATGAAGMDVVSQGISEALIATAIGLMAAIPAVIAYNYFLRRIKVLSSEMENFSFDFLNIVKRHFLK